MRLAKKPYRHNAAQSFDLCAERRKLTLLIRFDQKVNEIKVFFPSSLLFCETEGYVYECCVRRHKNSVNTSCYVFDEKIV